MRRTRFTILFENLFVNHFFENSFRLGIKGKIEYNFKHDIKLAVLAA